MLDTMRFRKKAGEVLRNLDDARYPQTYDYLAWLSNVEEIDMTPYEIATELVASDVPEKFPKALTKLIEELYLEAMEEDSEEASAAMNDLGAQYYDGGRGFEQNFSKAVRYYEMAAERGNRQAQENLGYCHYYGRNMPVDYEKAFHYFALGAFDGHLISLYKIGDMYLNGYYVKKNEKEAFCIFRRCLETMTEESEAAVAGPVSLRLGKMFLHGLGTEKDPKAALLCYQKAELYLFEMVKRGEWMYRKSLQAAIEGQQEARAQRMEELEERE